MPPLSPDSQAARDLAAEYAAKAQAYVELWAPVLRPMAEPVLSALPLARSATVIDIGAGSGTNLPALRAAVPAARLVAADVVPAMLRQIAPATAPLRVAMDARALALRSESADCATMMFMLFHLLDPVAGLAEARRVLRPGGPLGVATWGAEAALPGLAIWTEELNRAGAAPDTRSPRVTQQAMMDTPDKLGELCQRAGLGEIRTWTHTWRQVWEPETLYAIQASCGMPCRRLASLSGPARAECERRAGERLRELTAAERVFEPAVVYAVAER